MTFPILASAFLLAAAALALQSAAFTATRRSMVKVRSNQRRPADRAKSDPGL